MAVNTGLALRAACDGGRRHLKLKKIHFERVENVKNVKLHVRAKFRRNRSNQLPRLQQLQNSLPRTIVKAPKSCHSTAVLRSLH